MLFIENDLGLLSRHGDIEAALESDGFFLTRVEAALDEGAFRQLPAHVAAQNDNINGVGRAATMWSGLAPWDKTMRGLPLWSITHALVAATVSAALAICRGAKG